MERNSLESLSRIDKALNAMNNCPKNDVLHYHKDGCPSCDYPTKKKDAQKMELVKQRIMVDAWEDEVLNNPDDGSWKGR